MATCEWCGKEFEEDFDRDTFVIETNLDYENLQKCLCAKCAIEAIQDEADGVYNETCARCGKQFDLFEEASAFASNFTSYSGTRLQDYWGSEILCADCALNEV